MLIDPELERGHTYLLNNMGELLEEALGRAREDGKKLVDLEKRVNEWMQADNLSDERFSLRVNKLKRFQKVNNFVGAQRLIRGVPSLTRDFDKRINQEVHQLKRQSLMHMEKLETIRMEAAWFPFPRLLRGFNSDFNYCVQRLNEINQAELFEGEKFCQAQEKMQEVEERMQKITKRLTSLALIRDAVVYFLYVGKGFLWMEAIGLVLAIGGVPLLLYLGLQLDQSWAPVFWEEKWRFQRIALLGLSTSAMIIAAIKAAWGFERKKKEFLDKKRR